MYCSMYLWFWLYPCPVIRCRWPFVHSLGLGVFGVVHVRSPLELKEHVGLGIGIETGRLSSFHWILLPWLFWGFASAMTNKPKIVKRQIFFISALTFPWDLAEWRLMWAHVILLFGGQNRLMGPRIRFFFCARRRTSIRVIIFLTQTFSN